MESQEITGHLHITDSRTKTEYEIPVYDNYVSAKDLSYLQTMDGPFTRNLRILDNGFEHTACMQSAITHIDGHRGEIRFRGVPIQDLFRDNDYEEVLHVLIWGHLPSESEGKSERKTLNEALVLPKVVVDAIAAFPRDSETQPMITAGLSTFIAANKTSSKPPSQSVMKYRKKPEEADKALLRSIAYYGATVALVGCHKWGRKFKQPVQGRSLIGNLIFMMGFVDPEDSSKPDAMIESCLNKLWILYADHEMTNSTAAVLHVGSGLADPACALLAGIVCDYGPLHGSAIDLAYEQFEKVKTPDNVPFLIEMVKQKKTRLMGYGHRIYRTRDPRLVLIEELIKKHKDAVAKNPLLQVAFKIDEIANEDEYFVSRKLKANADLLGCFLYSALGFEKDIYWCIANFWRYGSLARNIDPANQTMAPSTNLL